MKYYVGLDVAMEETAICSSIFRSLAGGLGLIENARAAE